MKKWLHYADLQYIKYFFCGGFNTLFAFSVYCIGIQSGLDFRMANGISWVLGVMMSFMVNKHFVFISTYQHKQIVSFFASNMLSLVVSMSMLNVLIQYLYVDAIIASIITIPCVITINFFAFKYIVFK